MLFSQFSPEPKSLSDYYLAAGNDMWTPLPRHGQCLGRDGGANTVRTKTFGFISLFRVC